MGDFMALQSHLAHRFVAVFHDIRFSRLESAIWSCLCTDPNLRFVYYKGEHHTSWVGTGMIYRGFAPETFLAFHGDEEPYQCHQRHVDVPRVCWSPKVLPEILDVCTAGVHSGGDYSYSGVICCAKECG